MALPTRNFSSDLRWGSVLVFLLVGFINKGFAKLPNTPESCPQSSDNFQTKTQCKNCYKGPCCEKYANSNPKFHTLTGDDQTSDKYYDTATITKDGLVDGVVIYTAEADDVDRSEACGASNVSCPCGEVNYAIIDDYGVFKIDRDSGELRVPKVESLSQSRYVVKIVAQNPGSSSQTAGSSQLELTVYSHVREANDDFNVNLNNGYEDKDDYSHGRDKRSVGNPATTNVSFSLIKKAPHTDLVNLKVGQKISFELTITFPPDEKTNMLVELFTPDNETIIMMLCDVKVAKGGGLTISGTTDPVYHSIENNLFNDRVVIDIGDVTSNSGSETDRQIIINYDAVMLDRCTSANNGTTYWVSSGAEYNNESDVWVGQASFLCIHDPTETFSGTPTVNFTGPNTMSIGSSAVFTVDIFIPYPVVTLSFDAFVPLNTSNVMSICAISGKDTAVNYECGFDFKGKVHSLHQEGNVRGNARGNYPLGKAFNKGARETGNSDADNRISLQFVLQLFDDPTLIGGKYWPGAALEIGTDQIWAGQIEVEVVDKTTGSVSGVTFHNPAVTPNGEKTSTRKPVVIEARATIPQDTTGEYKLEVKGPAGHEIQICSVRVASAGGHLPCVDLDTEAVYLTSGTVVESATLDLKRISNIGSWGSVNSSANADDITFEAMVIATNYSTTTSYNVQFGFYVNGNILQTKTVPVTVETAGSIEEITNQTVPKMKMEFKSGTENVPVGGASRVALEITTVPGTIYPVMDIEFIMINDSEAEGFSPITICRTELTSVGKNLPCVVKPIVNKAITGDSKYKDGWDDRAIIVMGVVCNSGTINNTVEDTLTLETVVQFRPNHKAFATNGSQHWLSAGVMFSEKMMWVGQLAAFSINDAQLEAKVAPHVDVVVNGSAQTPVGYCAVRTLVIKTSSDDTAHYTINVTAVSQELTICSVRVLAKGHNMPCVQEDIQSTLTPDTNGRNIKSDIDLGVISNVGDTPINPNAVFDDNTLMIEIVVQLSRKATDASSHKYDININYGSASMTKQVEITATTDLSSVNTTASGDPTIDMGILPITGNDSSSLINKGQAKMIYLDVMVPEGATLDLTVKVLAPINMASVVEVRQIVLLEVGDNLPCLNRDQTEANYINRTSGVATKYAIASLSLGVLCNVGVKKNDSMANRIRVAAVVRLLKNAPVNVGDNITLSGSLNKNNEMINIIQHDLIVADNFTDIIGDNMTLLNDTAIKLNITDDPIVMKINEVKTIPIHLIIPPKTTTVVKFDVELPVNDSAVLTYKSLKASGSGKNLAGYGNGDVDEIVITEKSSKNTSQINKVYGDLGIVTNAGLSHLINQAEHYDDVITLELTVAMADSAINTADSTHWISLGVKIGIYIVILEHKVKVLRDGNEKPCIEFTGEVDNAQSDTTKVAINGLLIHSNDSTAESTNMTAFVLFPPFLKFKSVQLINDSLLECSHSSDDSMMKISCAWFYFTDKLAFTAVLEQRSDYKVPPQVRGNDAVITLATASTMHRSSDDFSCNMNYVNHTVAVIQKSELNCTTEVFGLVKATTPIIKDCQISGSEDYYDDGTPLDGRKGGKGYSPFVRKGSLKKERFFQVYMGNQAYVQKIEIDQGTVPQAAKVTKIHPYFSNDGYAWIPGTEIDVGAYPAMVDVGGDTLARYIRIYITDDDKQGTERLSVTFELHGCFAQPDLAADQLCNTVVKEEGIVNTDWYRSGFLSSGSNVYVCDAVADNGLKQACYRSSNGDSWEKLGDQVGCVVGHDTANNYLYGVANDGYTYLESSDNGKTWANVRKEKFEDAKKISGFTTPKKMEWRQNDGIKGNTPDAAHTDASGEWGATYDGLRKKNGASWPLRVNWAECCGK